MNTEFMEQHVIKPVYYGWYSPAIQQLRLDNPSGEAGSAGGGSAAATLKRKRKCKSESFPHDGLKTVS